MADDVDLANDLAEEINNRRIAEVLERAAKIPEGNPGNCDLCGEWTGRLVNGICAPCRDRYDLP